MGDGAEGIALGIIVIGLMMIWDFIVYLIPSCISAFVFYFTKSSSLKKNILLYLGSLIVYLILLYVLELFYPMDKRMFYYRFLKLFSFSTAIFFTALVAASSYFGGDKNEKKTMEPM